MSDHIDLSIFDNKKIGDNRNILYNFLYHMSTASAQHLPKTAVKSITSYTPKTTLKSIDQLITPYTPEITTKGGNYDEELYSQLYMHDTKKRSCSVTNKNNSFPGICTDDYKLGVDIRGGSKGYVMNINFSPSHENHVLMTVDPDVPYRENNKDRYYLHYLVINKKEIFPIKPPSTKKKGIHRYFTIYYTYNGKPLVFDINKYRTKNIRFEPTDRSCFDAGKFVNDNNLQFVDMVTIKI